jgi:histone H3/H4
MSEIEIWRSCGSCKKPIATSARYYACNVSTCHKSVYCSMDCFSMHVPIFKHRDAWAEERRAPKVPDMVVQTPSRLESARLVTQNANSSSANALPKDVLIVASKLKAYIDAKSGLNTSGTVIDRLSDIVRVFCDKAIENAKNDGRKTVMDRDF